MATKPAAQSRGGFIRETIKRELTPVLKSAWRMLTPFYEMPPSELATLPEDWILKTRINSWPLACLAIGAAMYAIFLALAFADGYILLLRENNLWLRTLVIPITGTYPLSVIPFIRRLLTQTLDPSIIAIYCVLVFSSILVFVFTKVPTSLLNQFRMFRAFFLFLFVAIIGTVGFNQLEGWTLEESLYTMVITMTTIGYGDFAPVTPWGQRFTILLSFVAIGIGGYLLTSVASYAIEGNFTRFIQGKRVDKQIVRMRNHYILCGAGNLGKQLALEFYKSQVPFVVIEQSPEVLDELLREIEIPYIQGDATHDEALQLAGVERSTGLIATLQDDKDNVFITLSARSLNDKLRIISRVVDEKNRKKLNNAGADVVISPQVVSGRRMASEMLHSEVVTFLDEMIQAEQQTGQIMRLEEIHIDQIRIPSLLEQLNRNELTILDIGQRTDLMVVAIKRGIAAGDGDPYIYTPAGKTIVERGDILIVIGTPEQRIKLQHTFLSENSVELWLSKMWA